MSSDKPNFLSQPVVKNIFMFRNGDPYFEARRIVINQKRVSNFEGLLREVTGGIQAPFGAVRNIYTPRGGHKVDCLESLQSGEQYVAAGKERFKKLDYQQIGSRRKRMLQTLPLQAKPLPPNRIIVSARFLKPLKEPCTIFVVANGDILDPAVRLLIHQRLLGQFEKVLEMITERMGLKVLGGVRSLYTFDGQQVTDGTQLENGQLYVAVGREKFKKLPYSDLLFTKPRGARRINGMKAYSLPPIYRFSKQNGNGKSVVRSSDSGDGDSKASPLGQNGNNKEHLSSIVREISQARLISLRKKRSGQSMTAATSENDDKELKADNGSAEDKARQDEAAEEKPADGDTGAKENGEKTEPKEEAAVENTTEEDKDKKEEKKEANSESETGEDSKGNDEQGDEKEAEATVGSEEKEEVEEEEVKEEVTAESKEGVKSEEQRSGSSNTDKNQDSKEKGDGGHDSSEGGKDEQEKNTVEEKQDKDGVKEEKSGKKQVNDVDMREEQKEAENSSDPEKTQVDNETKEKNGSRSGSSNSNQEDDVSKTGKGASKEPEEEEVSGEDDEVESEAELDKEEKKSVSHKDATENGEKGEGGDEDNRDKSKKEKD